MNDVVKSDDALSEIVNGDGTRSVKLRIIYDKKGGGCGYMENKTKDIIEGNIGEDI